MAGVVDSMISSLRFTEHSYGDEHELQKLGVWQFPDKENQALESSATRYWVVYIHGGAWRDPRIDHTSAVPGIEKLLAAPECARRIQGFASINYRLSPYPDFPQDPSSTPAAQLRAARHPDHLRDVCAGLKLLGRLGGLGSARCPFILYGHSCGATLALQVLMAPDLSLGATELPLPAAVVGFQGIYDLRGLNDRHGGTYGDFISGAFGQLEDDWDMASPARFKGQFGENWHGRAEDNSRKLVVLAHSPDDEDVDMAELDAMDIRLTRETADGKLSTLAFRDLTGSHDGVREDGTCIARVLYQVIDELDRLRPQGEHLSRGDH